MAGCNNSDTHNRSLISTVTSLMAFRMFTIEHSVKCYRSYPSICMTIFELCNLYTADESASENRILCGSESGRWIAQSSLDFMFQHKTFECIFWGERGKKKGVHARGESGKTKRLVRPCIHMYSFYYEWTKIYRRMRMLQNGFEDRESERNQSK